MANLREVADASRERFAGRVLWNLNSTAPGGGVAEMLPVLAGYVKGAGIESRWLVIDGDPEFFAITKRLHNRLHGAQGDAGDLGPAEAAHYAAVLQANADRLSTTVGSDDVVMLHDPQTAGLVAPLRRRGATVVWRCHVGSDTANDCVASGWSFLQPHLDAAQALVFSRRQYAPDWVQDDRLVVIPP